MHDRQCEAPHAGGHQPLPDSIPVGSGCQLVGIEGSSASSLAMYFPTHLLIPPSPPLAGHPLWTPPQAITHTHTHTQRGKMLTKLYQTIRYVAIKLWRSNAGVHYTVTGFGSQNHPQRECTVWLRRADFSPSVRCCHPTAKASLYSVFSLKAHYRFLQNSPCRSQSSCALWMQGHCSALPCCDHK